ncbi:MAG: PEP-CTERM sorting domain-containing protein [Terrimicrobiaceae bacterium]
MKIKKRFTALALGLAGGFLALAPTQAALTTYSPGDLFIGFRKTGSANTLAVNIGQASQFFTSALGGTATVPFDIQFGVVDSGPNAGDPVFDLSADLTATFGSNWADNPGDGTGVRWAVVGFTNNNGVSPTPGLTTRSVYITKPRTNPATQSATLGSIVHNTFSGNFNAFATGPVTGYAGRNSTANSTVAYIGAASGSDNWDTRAASGASFGLGNTRRAEQALSGAFSGPTDSVLDLYLAPNAGSTLVTSNTYLGNFTLGTDGALTFTPVPEPSTFALLAIGGTALMAFRRRNRSVTLAS